MMQSIVASLAVQHVKGDARFIFFDFTRDTALYDKRYPEIENRTAEHAERMNYYGELDVIATGGDSQLGGINFDQKIMYLSAN